MEISDNNKYVCICGETIKKGSKHKRDCKVLQKIRNDFYYEKEQEIIDHYKTHYSITKIIRDFTVNGRDFLQRDKIEKILKDAGIYEGMYGENYLKKKVEVTQKSLSDRYGVINPGQLVDGGWTKQNKIPYKKFVFLDDDFKIYKEKVSKITKENTSKIVPPRFCEYTGILFADEEGPTNPNDPRKRSIDHTVPIVVCYLNNISVEYAGSIDNIKFVLKFVNSIKGNSLEESFSPIALKIRKALINEGFESN
jgi:hypothetical protein